MKECFNCGFYDEDYFCTCPHSDKWYACPIDSQRPENIKKLEEYIKWDMGNKDENNIDIDEYGE